jgi:glycosyltransferase involved in cell wall biosynthesis
MKILHILGIGQLPQQPDHEAAGGTTRVVLEVARRQAAWGHEVVAAVVGRERWRVDWDGVRLVSLRAPPRSRLRVGSWKLDLSTLLPLLRLTLTERFDVIHAHEFNYLRYLPAAIRVTHFHNDPCRFNADDPSGMWEINECMAAARYSHAHIAVSRFVARQLRRRYMDLEARLPAGFDPDSRIRVVYNGTDLDRFSLQRWRDSRERIRGEWGAADDAVVFLFSGAVVPEKGVLHLARAFRLVAESNRRARLVLAGHSSMWEDANTDGEVKAEFARYQEHLRRELHPLEVRGQVVHLGSVPPADMPGVYAAADVVVIPSLVQEACPLTALEALSMGRPLVAARVGGLPEYATSNNSVLVPAGDVEALRRALLLLIDDDALREQLASVARGSAAAFTWARTEQELDALYRDLMLRRHAIVHAPAPAFYRF